MKILHIIPNIERGGAERAMIAMARGALEHGHEVHICVLGTQNAYAEEIPKAIPVHILGSRLSYKRLRDTLACRRALRALIGRLSPDILHSHLWPAARMAGWARGRNRMPHLVHIQDTMAWLQATDLRSRAMRFLTRHALRRPATYFVAVSQAVRDYAAAHLPWLPRTISVVYNGADSSFYIPIDQCPTARRDPNSPVTIGLACRLVPNKGVDVFLRALSLAQHRSNVRVLIAGDGGQRNHLEQLARDLDLTPQVAFVGTVRDMARFYSQIDLFVLPSLGEEGLPLTLVEAMAAAVPVVTTTVGGCVELVRHGIDGLLVPPNNHRALCDALDQLVSNVEFRKTAALNARHRAEEFSAVRTASQVLEIYHSVAANHAWSKS